MLMSLLQALQRSVRVESQANRTDMHRVNALNRQVFANTSFRHNQLILIKAAIQGSDILGVLPTGAGKSLTYQLPAIYAHQGVTIIVAPINALINEQVDVLTHKNVPALAYTSSLSKDHKSVICNFMRAGDMPFLYVSPEALTDATEPLRTALLCAHESGLINRVVIDEAHCIDKWGGDEFRPSFANLSNLRTIFPGVPLTALTATANLKSRKLIAQVLGMEDAKLVVGSIFRKNLHFAVVNKIGVAQNNAETDPAKEQILEIVEAQGHNKFGLVYTTFRKDAENVATYLNSHSQVSVNHFHAGCSEQHKQLVLTQWTQEHLQLVVATSALGMGMDKGDIAYVILERIPISPEEFIQMAGRGGRNGERANVIVLNSLHDFDSSFKKLPEIANSQRSIDRINVMKRFVDNRNTCRHKMMLSYFDDAQATTLKMPCGACDICDAYIEGKARRKKSDANKNSLGSKQMDATKAGKRHKDKYRQ